MGVEQFSRAADHRLVGYLGHSLALRHGSLRGRTRFRIIRERGEFEFDAAANNLAQHSFKLRQLLGPLAERSAGIILRAKSSDQTTVSRGSYAFAKRRVFGQQTFETCQRLLPYLLSVPAG